MTLSGMSADLDIFVLDGEGDTCNAANCIAFGFSSTSFTAEAGRTYRLVVDGYRGATSAYNISVECTPHRVFVPLALRAYKPFAVATAYSMEQDGAVPNLDCSEWGPCRSSASGSAAWTDLESGKAKALVV